MCKVSNKFPLRSEDTAETTTTLSKSSAESSCCVLTSHWEFLLQAQCSNWAHLPPSLCSAIAASSVLCVTFLQPEVPNPRHLPKPCFPASQTEEDTYITGVSREWEERLHINTHINYCIKIKTDYETLAHFACVLCLCLMFPAPRKSSVQASPF